MEAGEESPKAPEREREAAAAPGRRVAQVIAEIARDWLRTEQAAKRPRRS